MSKRILIIGNGMVSHKFCEKFIALPESTEFEIIVFGEEPQVAYDRVHLSSYFENRSVSSLVLADTQWYKEHGITLHLGTLIIDIDRKAKCVTDHQGRSYRYDYLVMATGSFPFVPKVAGINQDGIFVYRNIEDLQSIDTFIAAKRNQTTPTAVVLGGGLLGLEAAKAAMDMGCKPQVVELADRLMPQQLDKAAAQVLAQTLEQLNIVIHTGKMTTAFRNDMGTICLEFSDGTELNADVVIISAGIRPRDELGKKAALAIGKRGGIVVDDRNLTSDPNIYAIGEVASYQDRTYGLVAPGYEMANVAAHQILGHIDERMPASVDMSTELKVVGTQVASFGEAFTTEANVIIYENGNSGVYKRINVSKDGKFLLGGMLVGDTSDFNRLLQISKNKIVLPPQPEVLIIPNMAGDAQVLGGVADLPNDAIICSCEKVTKGNLVQCIQVEGADTIKDLQKRTKATTGCGGCKPMVNDLLLDCLEQMGRTVKPVICEHFPYSRQALFDLIKVRGFMTYDEALDNLGKGDGCEICKPALASIFAGIYNETAVKQQTIQDTNDRFLANIQRNGSYSVVPRVPGGEITPQKLIAMGEIAKKYNLYTKITGGQRIDMFGAELNDLPFIWEELIAAGFESGHAYGKALRTVKSCVGSTWCRYGMDESVSFAVELEQRYKGIRSPHKLKGGVSGCIRECAEARCKDFGVIATETGWNLYVCGNGGANPKHAQLLAENADNETCIKYIDRFLMYYIKTAPPLTRTAAWLEKLDGGMPYLRDIVIHDKLRICDQLEQEMQTLVDSYSCEWKEVVEDQNLRKRFRHFANSDDRDDNLEFVGLRDQKMPKRW